MAKYLLKRVLQSAVGLVLLVLIIFLMTRLTGDPTNFYLPKAASEQARLDFAQANGFNDPLYIQLFRYLQDVVRGDFGMSLFNHRPAMEVALGAFPVTLRLAFFTLALTIPISILLGSIAAMRPNGLADRFVSILTVTSSSVPQFWLAIVAIYLFAMQLRLLPTSGMDSWRHWILPILILTIGPLGILTQVVRSSMVVNLNAPYAKTAKAKGATTRRVVVVHALRNSLVPLTTVGGLVATGLVNGAVVVEGVFGFPGIGWAMIESIRVRDFTLTISCILLAAVAIFIINVLIDVLYSWLDPRVQLK